MTTTFFPPEAKRPISRAYLAHVGFYLLLGAMFYCGLMVEAAAQSGARPDRGVASIGSYSVSDFENISLSNGNMNLSIPIASLPPIAGGKLSYTLSAVYNSTLWDVVRAENKPPLEPSYVVDIPQLSDAGGWRLRAGYTLEFRDAWNEFSWVSPELGDPDYGPLQTRWVKAFLVMPDGSEHELRPLGNYQPWSGFRTYLRGYYKDWPLSTQQTMRYYSLDGSYLFVKVEPFTYPAPLNWEAYLPDGTRIQWNNGVQRITDTNGNSIKIYTGIDPETQQVAGIIEDEQTANPGPARKIIINYDPNGSGGQGAHIVKYQTVGGNWASIDINYGTTSVHGLTYLAQGQGCQHRWLVGNGNVDITVVRSIVLPQTEPGLPRRSFTFSYNSDITDTISGYYYQPICPGPQLFPVTEASRGHGGLSRMVTPTGAIHDYTYSQDQVYYFMSADEELSAETITKKVVTHDGVTDTWNYGITPGWGTNVVINPDGSGMAETAYPSASGWPGYTAGLSGKAGLAYRTNLPSQRIERHWTLMKFDGGNDSGANGGVKFNPVVDAEYTSLLEGGNPVKMSAKKYQHDFNGNVTQVSEYDWFDPALVTRDTEGVPTDVPGGLTPIRVTTTNYYNAATASSSANVYAKRDLSTIAPRILNARQQTIVGPSQTRFSYDNQAYGVAPTIGNLTQVGAWDNQAGTWRNTTYGYDSYGNRITITDPKNNVTNIAFDPSTHAQPTQVTVDPLNGTGAQTTTTVYDYWTGLVTSATDPNNQTTTTSYINQLLGAVDPFGRPGVVTGPPVNSVVDGVTYTNQQRKAKTTYFDDARQVVVESDLNLTGDYKLKSRASYDQLGRVIKTENNEDGAANYSISTETVYVQMGRIMLTSNPEA